MSKANTVYDIDFLEKERKRQFLSYKDLAEQAGEKYNPVFRMLTRKRKRGEVRNPKLVKKLALALGLKPEKIIKAA